MSEAGSGVSAGLNAPEPSTDREPRKLMKVSPGSGREKKSSTRSVTPVTLKPRKSTMPVLRPKSPPSLPAEAPAPLNRSRLRLAIGCRPREAREVALGRRVGADGRSAVGCGDEPLVEGAPPPLRNTNRAEPVNGAASLARTFERNRRNRDFLSACAVNGRSIRNARASHKKGDCFITEHPRDARRRAPAARPCTFLARRRSSTPSASPACSRSVS